MVGSCQDASLCIVYETCEHQVQKDPPNSERPRRIRLSIFWRSTMNHKKTPFGTNFIGGDQTCEGMGSWGVGCRVESSHCRSTSPLWILIPTTASFEKMMCSLVSLIKKVQDMITGEATDIQNLMNLLLEAHRLKNHRPTSAESEYHSVWPCSSTGTAHMVQLRQCVGFNLTPFRRLFADGSILHLSNMPKQTS